jgi:hypothetical protein
MSSKAQNLIFTVVSDVGSCNHWFRGITRNVHVEDSEAIVLIALPGVESTTAFTDDSVNCRTIGTATG